MAVTVIARCSLTDTFRYDRDANRIKGSIEGETITYIDNYFEWKTNTSDKIVNPRHYYARETRVAMRIGRSTRNYLFGDHLGSTAATTDENGNNLIRVGYFPWGTQRFATSTPPTTYRFTGQRYESTLGLYYYGARWYDSSFNLLAPT